MTEIDLAARVREDGVRFILAMFVDLAGKPCAKLVPVEAIDMLLEEGVGFAGYAVGIDGAAAQRPGPDGDARPGQLHADARHPRGPGAGALRPARRGQAVAVRPAGHPQVAARRRRRPGAWSCSPGAEVEYFLVHQGRRRQPRPADAKDAAAQPCYDARGLTRMYDHLTAVSSAMNALGWENYANDHEDANGQFEQNFSYSDALTTADRVITARYLISMLAEQRGMTATFMPKPFADRTGSGMHLHLSLWDDGDALFPRRGASRSACRTTACQFLAGILEHAPGMQAVLGPTVNSYKRTGATVHQLRRDLVAARVTYGGNDRTHFVRVPDAQPDRDARRRRLRQPVPGHGGRARRRASTASSGELPLGDPGSAGRRAAADAAARGRGACRPTRWSCARARRRGPGAWPSTSRGSSGTSSSTGTPRSATGSTTATSPPSEPRCEPHLNRASNRARGTPHVRDRRAPPARPGPVPTAWRPARRRCSCQITERGPDSAGVASTATAAPAPPGYAAVSRSLPARGDAPRRCARRLLRRRRGDRRPARPRSSPPRCTVPRIARAGQGARCRGARWSSARARTWPSTRAPGARASWPRTYRPGQRAGLAGPRAHPDGHRVGGHRRRAATRSPSGPTSAWCTTARSPTTPRSAATCGRRAWSSTPRTTPRSARGSSPRRLARGGPREGPARLVRDLRRLLHAARDHADGFAVVRDAIACKPAVIAETDAWVAMASEYRALAGLPGIARRPASSSPSRKGSTHGSASVDRRPLRDRVGPSTSSSQRPRAERRAARAAGAGLRGTEPAGRARACGRGGRPVTIDINGHAGYYAAGMNDGGTITIHGTVGSRRRGEHDVRHRPGQRATPRQSAGATGHGGLLVIEVGVHAVRHLA